MATAQALPRTAAPTRPPAGIERLAVALEIFLGLGAIGGGGLLSLAPDGHLLGMPLKMLHGTPFSSYLVPGLILLTVNGLFPLVVAALTVGRNPAAPYLTIAVGVMLIGWIAVEMVMLAGPGSIAWTIYLVLGTGIAALGIGLRRTSSAVR